MKEPTYSPYLAQMAWGSISPKIRVNEVDMKKPLRLPSASASRIDIAEFVMAQPSKIVTRS